ELITSAKAALTTVSVALAAAKKDGTPGAMKAAVNTILQQGPVGVLLQSASAGLSSFTQGGMTAVDTARALVNISAKLPPQAAQRWTARLLRAPYRQGLIAPVVNDAYAGALMSLVPSAAAFLGKLQASDGNLTAADFVR